MRRRHNAVAIAVGALLTTIALAIGLAIESPGLPGHELLDGATSVLRLSDPEPATTVVTLPAKLAAKHHVSARAAVKVRAHRRHGHAQVHTAVPAARRHRTSVGRTGAAQGQARKSTPTTPAPAATPAPAPTPARAATPAPAATAPKASPSPVAAKTAKADLKVASASVSRNGNVRVVLAVSQPANGTPTTATLPGQLNVNLNMAALRHASDAGPIALDTALDLVPDPSNASGVGLRMRMQLAPGDSATPTAPAEDPNGLSNVVTLRLAMPDTTPAPKPTPTPTPTPAKKKPPQ